MSMKVTGESYVAFSVLFHSYFSRLTIHNYIVYQTLVNKVARSDSSAGKKEVLFLVRSTSDVERRRRRRLIMKYTAILWALLICG